MLIQLFASIVTLFIIVWIFQLNDVVHWIAIGIVILFVSLTRLLMFRQRQALQARLERDGVRSQFTGINDANYFRDLVVGVLQGIIVVVLAAVVSLPISIASQNIQAFVNPLCDSARLSDIQIMEADKNWKGATDLIEKCLSQPLGESVRITLVQRELNDYVEWCKDLPPPSALGIQQCDKAIAFAKSHGLNCELCERIKASFLATLTPVVPDVVRETVPVVVRETVPVFVTTTPLPLPPPVVTLLPVTATPSKQTPIPTPLSPCNPPGSFTRVAVVPLLPKGFPQQGPETVNHGIFYKEERDIDRQFSKNEYICLASFPDGKGDLQVDDDLKLDVEHLDDSNSMSTWEHDFYNKDTGGVGIYRATNISSMFARGRNRLRLTLTDIWPQYYSSFPIYVTIWEPK